MTANEYDWNDYGYDEDDYVQEDANEPKASTEVKQESTTTKYKEGIKDIFKDSNYSKGNKGNLKKKNYSNQPKSTYTNSNNYYKPKDNQNRDGKPVFFNNSKKGDIPIVNSANPQVNTQYKYTTGNYNYVSNFNVSDKEKTEIKAPQFKEREGQFVELTTNTTDMRNNNKYYLSQDNFKSSNTNNDDSEKPKFFGKINSNNEQVEERLSNVIKKKQVEEELQMPVFLNSKKNETESVPIDQTKDLYTLKLSQHQSAPIKTKDPNYKEKHQNNKPRTHDHNHEQRKNKPYKDRNEISNFDQLEINDNEKATDVQFEERAETQDPNKTKEDKNEHSDKYGKDKYKNNKRNTYNYYQKTYNNYNDRKNDNANYYESYDDFDRNYSKYNEYDNYGSYENHNYNKKNFKSSVPIQHNEYNEDAIFNSIVNQGVEYQKQRSSYNNKGETNKPQVTKQTSNVSGGKGIVVEIPKGKSSLKELFK